MKRNKRSLTVHIPYEVGRHVRAALVGQRANKRRCPECSVARRAILAAMEIPQVKYGRTMSKAMRGLLEQARRIAAEVYDGQATVAHEWMEHETLDLIFRFTIPRAMRDRKTQFLDRWVCETTLPANDYVPGLLYSYLPHALSDSSRSAGQPSTNENPGASPRGATNE